MIDFLDYYSTGEFGDGVDVELIINGDFLDFLNVPVMGEFEEGITETIALEKLEAILRGHPEVMAKLRAFATLPGKNIKYLIGNHDAELLFPSVCKRITQAWDPNGEHPSEKVLVIGDKDRIRYPEFGIEIRHGNQFEAGNQLDFKKPVLKLSNEARVLNIPWGSIYILKIINRLKWERVNVDKVRPIKVFLLFGLFSDTWFTLRFMFLSFFYFLRTRLLNRSKLYGWKNTIQLLMQEMKSFLDLEDEALAVMNEDPKIKTVIFGHTHLPMHRVYDGRKQYVNTGTWTKMVGLDPRHFGEKVGRTYAYVKIANNALGQPEVEVRLNQWDGRQGPFQTYNG